MKENLNMSTPMSIMFCLLLVISGVSCAELTIPQLQRLSEIQPIELHARFVDQLGVPLAGVQVHANIWCREPGGMLYNEKDLGVRGLNADGYLHIDGEMGGYLRLAIDDDRYFLGDIRRKPREAQGIVVRYSKNGGELFWLEHGTKEQPTTITAWKKEGGQALISVTGDMRFAYSKREFGVDLVTGKVVDDGGDLRVSIEAPEDEEIRKASADHLGVFPYKVSVVAADGGFSPYLGRESSEYFEGLMGILASDFLIRVLDGPTRTSDRGTSGVPFMGFVKLRAGKLVGRLKLYIGMEGYYRVEQGRVIVRIDEALLNASGSRSLESDPTKLSKLTLTDARKKPELEPKKP